MKDFELIWQKYRRPLELWLIGLCGDQTLAEEIAAETMLRALMNIGSFRAEASIFTWLCTIARNLLVSEYRRRKHLAELDATLEPTDLSANVADAVDDRDTARRIALELEALDEPMREVFILHALEDVPLVEISRRFHKSESWARVVYYRAKAKIAERIGAVDEK